MTQTPELGAPEELSADDAKALARLLQRGLGKGFRLILLEVATWRVRSRILAWVRDQIALHSGSVVEIDVAELPGQNLWSELGERITVDEGAPLVLALHGFQDAVHGQPDPQRGVYRQLNVQRDLFVRDVACVWLVMIHPQGSRYIQDIAPDFCDFVSLWIRASEPSTGLSTGTPIGVFPSFGTFFPVPDRFQSVGRALDEGRFVDARDALDTAMLGVDAESDDAAAAWLLRSRLEYELGNISAARTAIERARGVARDERLANATHEGLAVILLAQGDLTAARAHLEHVLAEKTRLGDTGLSAADTILWLALAHHVQGDLANARSLIERALAMQVEQLGTTDHACVADSLMALANVLRAVDDLTAARATMAHADAILARLPARPSPPAQINAMFSRGQLLSAEGDLVGAGKQLSQALSAQIAWTGDHHPDAAALLQSLARVFGRQGNLVGARLLIERALAIQAALLGTQRHHEVAYSLYLLAHVHRAQGDLEGALELFERVLAIQSELFASPHYSTAMTEADLAQVLADRGALERARPLAAHALETLTTTLGPAHPTTRAAAELVAELASAPE